MKKLSTLAVIAIAAATFVGCGNSAPKAELKSDTDTLAYAFGMAQGQQLTQFLLQQGIDSTMVDDFAKGVNDAVKAGDDKKQKAYMAGLQIGQMISQQWVPGLSHEVFGEDSTKTISVDNLLAGFFTSGSGKKGLIAVEKAQEIFQSKMDAIQIAEAEKKFSKEKKASEAAMAKVAKEPGVQKLANGVYYKVLTEGKGEKPTETSNVKINYEGKLLVNDTIFDSSYQRKQPQVMNVAQVVPGFKEALKNMPVGSKWEVYIPQEQAYGHHEQGGGKIPAFSALKFTIELLSIEAAPEQPQMQMIPQGAAPQPAK